MTTNTQMVSQYQSSVRHPHAEPSCEPFHLMKLFNLLVLSAVDMPTVA